MATDTPTPTATATNTATATSTATPTATGVSLGFSPASAQHTVGEVFQLTVALSTGSQQVDGAETHITFDPTKLQVTDAAGTPATTIVAGATFEAVLQNRVDNTTGLIDFAAGTFSSPLPSGNLSVATITFKAIAATTLAATSVSYSTTGRGTTSRITFNGAALPITVSSATVNIASAGGSTPILVAFEPDAALPGERR